jgi:chromosome segregation ATPase
VRTEVTRTGDAQIRNARAAEAEMKRKVDAYGLENDRLREANDALQQQLRTAQSAGDGAVKSMREVESAYAALEGEVTRVKASLTREQEEHAATKRSLQRTVNELKESGDAKEALAARARTPAKPSSAPPMPRLRPTNGEDVVAPPRPR